MLGLNCVVWFDSNANERAVIVVRLTVRSMNISSDAADVSPARRQHSTQPGDRESYL